jgi:hypothetical protein
MLLEVYTYSTKDIFYISYSFGRELKNTFFLFHLDTFSHLYYHYFKFRLTDGRGKFSFYEYKFYFYDNTYVYEASIYGDS